MASRHQGRHKPRHHNHAVKPAHTFKTTLPPLPTQASASAPAPAQAIEEQTQSKMASETPASAE